MQDVAGEAADSTRSDREQIGTEFFTLSKQVLREAFLWLQ